ncbi:hypothetical protein HAX54_045609, partial [Datura stramonium]|nr:hypothetical protein [Datura stramonium]
VGDIFMVNVEQGVGKGDEHAIAASSKRKKAKSTWMKQYSYSTKSRKWVRKSHPKDDSPSP